MWYAIKQKNRQLIFIIYTYIYICMCVCVCVCVCGINNKLGKYLVKDVYFLWYVGGGNNVAFVFDPT